MNASLLLRMIWRDVRFHPLLWGLSLLGVAMGVGGWLGMEGATSRAESAFESSLNATFGDATHVVENRTGSLDESTYFRLARTFSGPVTPLLESYGRMALPSGRTSESPSSYLRVIGIDALSYGQFETGVRQADIPFDRFLAGQPVLVLSPDLRKEFDRDDELEVRMNGERRRMTVVGFLSDDTRRRTILMDVGFMQKHFSFGGSMSRILLKQRQTDGSLSHLNMQLGEDAVMYPTGRRTRSVRSMLSSFRWNLRALSFLALFVGGFLVYSTMYLYASRQSNMISLLKTMGTSDRSICFLLFGALALLGVVGSALGCVLGVLLSSPLGELVQGTVNRLYIPLFTTGDTMNAGRLTAGFLLGLTMTFLGGFKPVWDRIGEPPHSWDHRELEGGGFGNRSGLLFCAGLAGWGAATVLFLSVSHILAGFASCFLIAFGGSLMSPLVLDLVSRLPAGGTWTRMVTRNVRFYGSRTSVMVAVLVAAFSLVLSVSFMVDSFRDSVHQWINSVIKADHYVRSIPEGNVREDVPLDPQFLNELRQIPEVKAVGLLAEKTIITSDGKPLTLRGIDPQVLRDRLDFQFNDAVGNPWERLSDGQLWLSEPGAFRLNRSAGQTLTLPVSGGINRSFPIGAVYNDYSTEWAVAYMRLSQMKQLYDDVTVSSAALFTGDANIRDRLTKLADSYNHYLESNQQIKRDAMAEFDRTFAVTDVMEIVASLVAGIGLLILLISFTQSRAWIFGRMSAVGTSRPQLGGLVTGESLLISAVAFLMSLPTGLFLSYVLLQVINRQSFGWLIPFQFRLAPIGMVFLLLMMTLFVALIFPLYKLLTIPLHSLLQEGRS